MLAVLQVGLDKYIALAQRKWRERKLEGDGTVTVIPIVTLTL